jgi:hypothetical protein
MSKLLVPLAALFLMSGCCRVFGICASASVHTSVASPEEFAQQDNNWPNAAWLAPKHCRNASWRESCKPAGASSASDQRMVSQDPGMR